MSTFLAIGLGPIQTGIFLLGAAEGGFSRIVVAEVDNKLGNAVNDAGGKICVNIATSDSVLQKIIPNVEVLNPLNENHKKLLIKTAAEADEIATALPSVNFFPQISDYLRKGFLITPDKQRFIYTAENNNHAAESLSDAVKQTDINLKNTYFLNTVIGKMSSVVSAENCAAGNLKPLCHGADKGHLVEQFNKILISSAPSIEKRKVKGLIVKKELYPFEEAKLYGHNAIHFLLAVLGLQEGKKNMPELAKCNNLIEFAKSAFIEECGKALCSKWNGFDELFTENGFDNYAEDLMIRMVNPFLCDSIPRITRDLPRKLGWDDRVIGTMRLVINQGIPPLKLSRSAAFAASSLFGMESAAIRNGLKDIWPSPWNDEHEKLFGYITDERSQK